ncbi:hypothetical protein [Wolbachia endosymbiont of Drosophila tristis]|uniref:hypothetical protein n=1 Tax=Wolbachia endosymbiont of Drosophila tristis TaxID=267696 RepID=UPI0023A95757|nr:hypothetical protein [Wolbachia endosymbiont of Drosophila tristis]MDE5065240.1 hypothetical protein [Wolbachia endosymbiont of Drosophila tristis]MDU8920829.1 hypothetical protein [Wolbachia endosymbiont of Drosophila tristis]
MTVVRIPAASLPCHPSSPLWCHPSSPDYLDPGKLIVHYSNIFDQKLDSSELCCIAAEKLVITDKIHYK